MSTDCAVCYVSDFNFLLPSLVSAVSIRRFIPAHKADIFVFTVGVDSDTSEQCALFLAPYGIRIVSIDSHPLTSVGEMEFPDAAENMGSRPLCHPSHLPF